MYMDWLFIDSELTEYKRNKQQCDSSDDGQYRSKNFPKNFHIKSSNRSNKYNSILLHLLSIITNPDYLYGKIHSEQTGRFVVNVP